MIPPLPPPHGTYCQQWQWDPHQKSCIAYLVRKIEGARLNAD